MNRSIALKPNDTVEFLSQNFADYILASEDFFDKLTVEQEFMSGVDTDKVCGSLLFTRVKASHLRLEPDQWSFVVLSVLLLFETRTHLEPWLA